MRKATVLFLAMVLLVAGSVQAAASNAQGSAALKESYKQTAKLTGTVDGTKTYALDISANSSLSVTIDLSSMTQPVTADTIFALNIVPTFDKRFSNSISMALSEGDKTFDGKKSTFTVVGGGDHPKKISVLTLMFNDKKKTLTVKYSAKSSLIAPAYATDATLAISDSATLTVQLGSATSIIPLTINGQNKAVPDEKINSAGSFLNNVSISGTGKSL